MIVEPRRAATDGLGECARINARTGDDCLEHLHPERRAQRLPSNCIGERDCITRGDSGSFKHTFATKFNLVRTNHVVLINFAH